MATKVRSKKQKLAWHIEKYYRWYRRWHQNYFTRVRVIEEELGGELRPC